MSDLTEETKNEVEMLLDDLIVKKLDVSSQLKSLDDTLIDFANNIREIKTLSKRINQVKEDVLDEIKPSLESIEEDITKNTSKVATGLKKLEDKLDVIKENQDKKIIEIEKNINQNNMKNKVLKILIIIFGVINVISLGILIVLFMKQFGLI